jgi:hypothetical protein
MASGKAVVIREHGGTDALQFVADFGVRAPASGEVLLKLVATSVNPVDVYVRAGTYASKEFPKARAAPQHRRRGACGWLALAWRGVGLSRSPPPAQRGPSFVPDACR